MKNILIGTSGFSYKDWVGPVYPPGTPAKNYLSLYEKEFNFTELNFSYYRQPDPRTLERMAHVTGDDFQFAIKAYKGITHEISGDCESEIKLFRNGVAPLIQASKLAVVLIQFPYSFHYTAESRKHLLAVCRGFEGIPAAVEFRGDDWQRESVYRGLADLDVALVNVDAPDLRGLPKPGEIVTSHIAYARFHGRNKKMWWKGDNTSRYDYLYSDAELSEWISRIKNMTKKSSKVIVAFNNHWKGQAVTNARKVKEFLTE
jgi:uncharacterized protein YecE (DUF72 family)